MPGYSSMSMSDRAALNFNPVSPPAPSGFPNRAGSMSRNPRLRRSSSSTRSGCDRRSRVEAWQATQKRRRAGAVHDAARQSAPFGVSYHNAWCGQSPTPPTIRGLYSRSRKATSHPGLSTEFLQGIPRSISVVTGIAGIALQRDLMA